MDRWAVWGGAVISEGINVVRGGMAGCPGGAVLFPGLGTATACIGGAVLGGAVGFIEGAVAGVAGSLYINLLEVTNLESSKLRPHISSFMFGIIGTYLLMVFAPFGSTNPTSFGFYWAIILGMVSSFSTAWTVKKFQKKPEE